MEPDLISSLMLFVSVAAIVGFATDNIKRVLESPDRTDNYELLGAVIICVVFNITIIEDLAHSELQESGSFNGRLQALLLSIRPWLDNLISGAALAGGAGRLLRKIKSEQAKVSKAAAG